MADIYNLTDSKYKNIRELIPDFYSIYPTIKSQIAQILPLDNNVNYAENPRVDIEVVARKIGIKAILLAPPEAVRYKHSLLLERDMVLLNEEDSNEELRFSIAHEIANFVIGDNNKNMSFIARAVNNQWESLKKNLANSSEFNIMRVMSVIQKEIEKAVDEEIADYFAANLLVPTKRFLLWKNKSDEEIACAFEVSITCIQKRRLEIEKENEINLKEMMNRIITISRGNVIGIGKVKIPKTQEFNHEIQLLSFLDIQESKTSFVSTCIHLHIDGYGKTVEEAEEDMVENIYYFLCQNFSILSPENAWENLRNLFKSDKWSNELWDAYHEVQIQLSINGIQTDNTAELLRRLKNLEDRVKELEKQMKNVEVNQVRIGLAREIRKLAKDIIVDKTYWGVAA
jgi:Zn-dependent peptidase ImmA (M78 family)